MAGYIGSKAVLLSTTAAVVTGDADIGGDLTVDTNTLVVDAANNRVGIGTSSPAVGLHVQGPSGDGLIRIQPQSGGRAYDLRSIAGSNFTIHDASAGAERLRITPTGSVGIGTSSPSYELHVVDSGGAAQTMIETKSASDFARSGAINDLGNAVDTRIYGSTAAGSLFNNSRANLAATYAVNASAYALGTNNAAPLVFGTNNTERMRIDASGNLLVGTTTVPASNRLTVDFTATTRGIVTQKTDTSAFTGHVSFRNSNGEVGYISTSGTATSYNTSSDYRLKENVVPLAGAADRLAQIPVHRFNFIADPNTVVDGFLAHEVQAFVPECVTGQKDEVDADGNPVYQGIDQSKLVPLLTAALQEALTKIDALEARIVTLEGGAA